MPTGTSSPFVGSALVAPVGAMLPAYPRLPQFGNQAGEYSP
ncbi:hypothetical protein [Micromonospora sp. CPCC 206061]